jgi:hypothetical protein
MVAAMMKSKAYFCSMKKLNVSPPTYSFNTVQTAGVLVGKSSDYSDSSAYSCGLMSLLLAGLQKQADRMLPCSEPLASRLDRIN